ncbi:MAG: PEP-CTERM sorting domain-containing protein [Phycisphaerales bacterium]
MAGCIADPQWAGSAGAEKKKLRGKMEKVMMRRVIAACALSALMTGSALAGIQGVVPSEFENVDAPSSFLFFGSARGYQFLIHESELTDYVGLSLNGLTWRAGSSSGYPSADQLINNFEIRLSEGVAPADRTTNFASNIVGAQTLVRTGSLAIPAGSYPGGGSPNEWGLKIGFDRYVYNGGHLVIEIRHTGTALSGSLDATSTSTDGYGTRYASVWGSGFDTGGSFNANFIITRLNAVPAPGALALMGVGLIASRRRRRN